MACGYMDPKSKLHQDPEDTDEYQVPHLEESDIRPPSEIEGVIVEDDDGEID